MTHGLPAIVARNPGNAEWVSDGTTGYLVDGANEADWADRLISLTDDPSTASRLGEGARSVACHGADWSRNAALLVDLYRRTAAQRPADQQAR